MRVSHTIILSAMLTCAVCRGAFPHSVTQGSFANPCVYLAAEGGNPAGFDSGLQSGGKELTIKITNDQERKLKHVLCSLSLLTRPRDSHLVLL